MAITIMIKFVLHMSQNYHMETEWYLEVTDYAPQGRAGYPIL